ncbi:MAG: ribonuclease D, partial [Gammaproteobacteria bacterium]|nr:ribonuclease D [Gammaproteobacteria bacterium]
LVDISLGMIKRGAREHRVSPNSLATRKELELLLAGDPDTALLHGWRHELCGGELEGLLSGGAYLTIENGEVTISGKE